MPHVEIKCFPGRTEEVKTKCAEEVAKAISETMGCDLSSVSIAIKEIDKMVRYRKGLTIASGMAKGEEVIYAIFARPGDDLVVKTDTDELLARSVDKLPSTTRIGKMKNVFGKHCLVKAWLHRTGFVIPEC